MLLAISDCNALVFMPSMKLINVMNRRSSILLLLSSTPLTSTTILSSNNSLLRMTGSDDHGDNPISGMADNGILSSFVEGKVHVSRGEDVFSLSYRIYNPASPLTPLVIIHGGP